MWIRNTILQSGQDDINPVLPTVPVAGSEPRAARVSDKDDRAGDVHPQRQGVDVEWGEESGYIVSVGEQEDAGRVSCGQASQAVVFNLNVGKNEQGQCCGIGISTSDPPKKKDERKKLKLHSS